MRSIIRAAVVLAAMAIAMPAAASDQTDVMVVVKDYNAALNNGDFKAAAADSAGQLAIIDEFAPFSWYGAGATRGWFDDYAAWTKRNSVTHDSVVLSTPWRVDVEGDRAYAVVPATFTYLKGDTQVVESGAVWTFALEKANGAWRIVSWAWSKH